MRNFLIGVAVGAAVMGYHTGYIKVNLGTNDSADKPGPTE
jgi:hypothetical protein